MSSNSMFVAAAFAATWFVILGYLFHLYRTTRRARALAESVNARGAR
jgi:CcmD family protein